MIATYVSHKGKWWRVSTINRESSAIGGYGHKYAETLVWDWDVATQKLGSICHTDSWSEDSIHKHQQIVNKIHEGGAFWEESE